jgi:hypothetical protein
LDFVAGRWPVLSTPAGTEKPTIAETDAALTRLQTEGAAVATCALRALAAPAESPTAAAAPRSNATDRCEWGRRLMARVLNAPIILGLPCEVAFATR